MKKVIVFPVLLLIFLLSSCKDFKEINVSKIENFQVKKLTQEGIEAEVKVTINNPNTIGFSVFRSKCDVYYGGVYLGKAKLSKRVKIGANSNSEHTFKLKGKFKDMSFDLMGTLLSGRAQNLELKGYLTAGKLFYRKKFPLDRKEKLGMFK
ncbi:MAG: LEA type 2 family protein [Bacteroidota bacterium]|nr:LEA type 2 family protein [Bacteroidota bacterium]